MEDKIFVKRNMSEKPFLMAPLEIIIPYHNQISKVANILSDILATVTNNRYLVTLVDDGSTNNNLPDQLKDRKLEGVRVLSQTKGKGFGAAVNMALKNPFSDQIPYVLIMHSDIRLKDLGWLQNLGNSLVSMKSSGVKMVSPVTNNPVEKFDQLRASKASEKPDVVLENAYLPMYCALCHRELFSRVGLLEEFPYAGLEAEEFALRMRKKNFKQGVCGASWVQHEGRGTLSQYDGNKKVQDVLEKARHEFASRKA